MHNSCCFSFSVVPLKNIQHYVHVTLGKFMQVSYKLLHAGSEQHIDTQMLIGKPLLSLCTMMPAL